MLVDHGRLGERYVPALDRLFRNADPYFVIQRPTRRPSIVAPIRERADSNYVGSDWTAGAAVDDAITGRTIQPAAAAPTYHQGRTAPEPQRPDAEYETEVAGGPAISADDGWVVLAEETWLRWLDWKRATETRVGARLEPRFWASSGR